MSNNPVNVLDLGFLKLGKYQNIPGTWNFRPGKYQEKPGKTNKFILYIQTIKNLFKPGLVEIGANCLHCSSLLSYFRRTIRQKIEKQGNNKFFVKIFADLN